MKPDQVFGFEEAGWPALLIDRSAAILRANQCAIEVFGSVVLSGAKLSSIWSPENAITPEVFLEKWKPQPAAWTPLKLKARGASISYSAVVCAVRQGEERFFVLQLFPEGAGSGASNQAEGVLQKQRLDVAVQLARSVSLDFKNALGGVLGHSSLLLMQAEPNHPWRKSLVEIEKAVRKGADAASSLGSFGRQDRQQPSVASGNLNAAINRAVEGLSKLAETQGVRWEFQLERQLFAAKFDEQKLQQAFTKVIENAIEAMPPSGGTVRISSRNLTLSESTQDRTAKLIPGTYVCAEISDSGCGMDSATLARIFEPFFTTKPTGRHRGLGLPWVYGIITNLRGAIAVSSQPSQGTSVRVYLSSEEKLAGFDEPFSAELGGKETILLVDDEQIIAAMGETVLSAYGYRVITALSGPKAIEILSSSDLAIDLLVTDLVMPGMSGTELVERAQKLRPQLPVVMMSGALTGGEQSSKSYLPKPFTSRQLLEKVRSILRRK